MVNDYKDFIESDDWKVKRKMLISERRVCERCGTDVGLQVHHRHYNKEFGTEKDDDLLVLCEDCHNNAHADLHLGKVSNPYCPMCNARMAKKGNLMVCSCGTTVDPRK